MDKLVLTDEQIIDHVNNIFMDLFEIEEEITAYSEYLY